MSIWPIMVSDRVLRSLIWEKREKYWWLKECLNAVRIVKFLWQHHCENIPLSLSLSPLESLYDNKSVKAGWNN